MKKLTAFKRLNFSLTLRILYIYLRRVTGFKARQKDSIYLNYFFALKRCDMRHVSEEKDCFKVITVDGVYLYMRKFPSSDGQVLYQIWKEKEYDVVVEYIRKNFREKVIRIVDAGANVGYASVFLHHKLKDMFDVRLIIVEPSESNLNILRKNFEANGIHSSGIEKAGLFNKSCYLHITTDFRDGKDWSLRVEEVSYPTDLRAVEIPEIMTKYDWDRVDFFKIDIEGSEKYLFENDTYSSKFLEKIRLISIEIHEEVDTEGRIEGCLTNNRFEHFRHGEITIGANKSYH